MNADDFHAAIWEALDPLDAAFFQVVAAPGATDGDVERVQALTAVALPPEFIAFSQRRNGLAVIAKPEVWPESKAFDVGPAWTFWPGVIMLGIDGEDLPEWAGITNALSHLADYGVTNVLPLFKIEGDGSRYWGVDADGQSVLVFDGEVEVLNSSIPELYAIEIAELADRQKRMAERIAQSGGA